MILAMFELEFELAVKQYYYLSGSPAQMAPGNIEWVKEILVLK